MRLCESQRRPCSAAQSAGRDPSSRSLISPHRHPACHVAESGTSSMAVWRVFSRPRNFMKTTQIESFSFTKRFLSKSPVQS